MSTSDCLCEMPHRTVQNQPHTQYHNSRCFKDFDIAGRLTKKGAGSRFREGLAYLTAEQLPLNLGSGMCGARKVFREARAVCPEKPLTYGTFGAECAPYYTRFVRTGSCPIVPRNVSVNGLKGLR